MATQVPYKIYTYKDTSLTPTYDFMPDMNMTNSSYANSQMREVSNEEFLGVYNQNKSYYDDYYNRNTTPGLKEAFQSVINGAAGPIQSGYIIDPNTGNLSTQSALDSQAANVAGVANGTLTEISPGMYVPVGSAGDYASQGMTQEQQLQQPSVQQQVQSQGLTPASPDKGTSTVAQVPTFDQALFQEYRNRPDLQALYNPDGTPKNPNDPRLAGIPSLQEWAMKYGINESALLKSVAPAQPIIPTTPISLNPSAQVPSSVLTNAKTESDVQGLIQANSKKYGDIRDEILKAMMPAQAELDLEKKLTELDTLSRNINLSAQAGINKIKNQPVAMNFIVGQAKSVMEDANLQLQTMAAEQANVVDRLGLAQKSRQTALNVLETLYQFDKEDQALNDAKSKLQKAEQEAAKEFAMQYGITAPFYLIGKTVYNSATGKPYEDEKSFFAAGGKTDFSNVQQVRISQPETDKLLSPTEAKTLGVPYGTTKGQAAQLGITPFKKTSSSNKSGPTSNTSYSTGNSLTNGLKFTSSSAINQSIPSVISRAGGLTDSNRYDLWDKVAAAIESQGKSPTDYDSVLWKYFHPEGSSGYKKYVLGQSSSSSNSTDLP